MNDSSLAANAFQQFALTAEQIGPTTKRLTKAALLGAYDILCRDGQVLIEQPDRERRAILEAITATEQVRQTPSRQLSIEALEHEFQAA